MCTSKFKRLSARPGLVFGEVISALDPHLNKAVVSRGPLRAGKAAHGHPGTEGRVGGGVFAGRCSRRLTSFWQAGTQKRGYPSAPNLPGQPAVPRTSCTHAGDPGRPTQPGTCKAAMGQGPILGAAQGEGEGGTQREHSLTPVFPRGSGREKQLRFDWRGRAFGAPVWMGEGPRWSPVGP